MTRKNIMICHVFLMIFIHGFLGAANCFGDNLLPNGSFEITSVPNIPDCFDQYLGPINVKDWYKTWNIDTIHSFHGQKSLRLDISSKEQINRISVKPHFSIATIKKFNLTPLVNDEYYTFSLYMKSDQQNFPVKINYAKSHYVTVGKEWKRYVFTEKVSVAEGGFVDFSVIPGTLGKLWVDALQIEKGQSATTFHTSKFDNNLFPIIEPQTKFSIKNETDKLKPQGNLSIKTEKSFYSHEDSAAIFIDNMNAVRDKGTTINVGVYHEASQNGNSDPPIATYNNVTLNNNKFQFDIRALPAGNYKIVLNLANEFGQSIQQAETNLVKLEPKSTEVKIDQVKRVLLVENEPFPFIGACFMRVHQHYEDFPTLLKQIREKGYTVIIPNFADTRSESRADKAQIRQFLDTAHDMGLKVVPWLSANARKDESGALKQLRGNFGPEIILDAYIKEADYFIPEFMNHPAILAWYLFDEVYGLDLIRSKFTESIVKHAKNLDPHHPVFVNYGDVKREFLFYDKSVPGEIISLTQYHVPIAPLSDYAKWTSIETIAAEGKKPVLLWLQFWSGYGRYPTPTEFSCMTYLSLTNGATGIMTWPIMPSSKQLWDHMEQVSEEVKFLFPIIINNDHISPETVQLDPSSTEYIHTMVKAKDGDLYIIAVNAAPYAVNATFTLKTDFGNDKLEVVFGKEINRQSTKAFHADLGPYERGVYRIKDIGNIAQCSAESNLDCPEPVPAPYLIKIQGQSAPVPAANAAPAPAQSP